MKYHTFKKLIKTFFSQMVSLSYKNFEWILLVKSTNQILQLITYLYDTFININWV